MCTLLQKKVVSAVDAVLCPEWDLIASISTEKMISVYRIMTWDKLASRSLSEFAEHGTNTIVDLCHNGTKLFVASMGFGVLDIENGLIDKPVAAAALNITAHTWISLDTSNTKNDLIILSSYPYQIAVFANAQSPIALIDLLSSISSDSRLLCHISAYNCSLISLNTAHRIVIVGDVEMQDGLKVKRSSDNGCLQAVEHAQSTLTTFHKRLKDAWKLLNLKLELMRNVLRSYQLEVDCNNGIDGFFNSVLLGGLWHPAASVIFSQHWNEQGLQRQISGFETAFGQLIEDLMLEGEWTLLQAYKTLQQHHQSSAEDDSSSSSNNSKDKEDKVELCKQVLFAKDRLLMTAQKNRKQFRDFFEFLRVFMQEASGKAATTATDGKTEDNANNEAAFFCSRIEVLPSLDGGFDQVFATLLAEINRTNLTPAAAVDVMGSISYGAGLHQLQISLQSESSDTHSLAVSLTNQRTIPTTAASGNIESALLFDDYFLVKNIIIRAIIEAGNQQSVVLKINDVKNESNTFDLTLTNNRTLRKVLVKFCPASEDGVHVLAVFLQFVESFPPELCLVSFTATLEDLELKNRIVIKMLSKFAIEQFQLNLKRSTASFVGMNGAVVLLDVTEALWDDES